MDLVPLGRTGLSVGVAGLGCGGHSRLGLATGHSPDDAVAVVRRALDLGITFIDTAEAYGTEEVVGGGISGRRDEVVLSTKAWIRRGDSARTGPEIREALEGSLRRLGTDHVDVYHLHGVPVRDYDYAVAELVPAVERLRDEGKVLHAGITEVFGRDTGHRMLERGVPDGHWSVVMVGFNILNQSARDRVFPATTQAGIGTLIMFAVRRALSSPDAVRDAIAELRERGELEGSLDPDDPLGFLVRDSGASSLTDAAYRFARHEPGAEVVLTGTGSVEHLEQNVRSICAPPLPDGDAATLRAVFARVDSVSGN